MKKRPTARTLIFFKKLALKRGETCLNEEYVWNEPLKIKCSNNHIYLRLPINYRLRNAKCEKCFINVRRKEQLDMIKTCRELASRNGGSCLSRSYKNGRTLMKWKCENNHSWKAPWLTVKKGHWCQQCYRTNPKRTIGECQVEAQKRNANCISDKFVNVRHPMMWQCLSCNHQWETTFQSFTNGKGKSSCPECFKKKNQKGNSLDTCRKIASQQGGQCLSLEYHSNKYLMKWECSKGHTWEETFKHIKSGVRWCPHIDCKKPKVRSYGQNIVRKYFEKRFGVEFRTVYPEWLKNPRTNQGLEIDGFSELLGIGFEYQGSQHYRFVPFFHRTIEKFKDLQRRDRLKRRIFKKRGLTLVIIKEFKQNIKEEDAFKLLDKIVDNIVFVK